MRGVKNRVSYNQMPLNTRLGNYDSGHSENHARDIIQAKRRPAGFCTDTKHLDGSFYIPAMPSRALTTPVKLSPAINPDAAAIR